LRISASRSITPYELAKPAKETSMKLTFKSFSATLAAAALTFLLVPTASALCGAPTQPKPTSSHFNLYGAQPGHLVMANDLLEDVVPIIGMWHVKFFLQDTPGFTNGTEFDAGYSQWHSDGTEIMQSAGRPPLIGDMCMGIWEQVGVRTYKLNHFAAAYDNSGLNLIGPAQIQELVVVDRAGNAFSGTFTIDQYTEAGNRAAHFQGNITGTRMTVNTPAQSIF
jgi:hypothetical protein